MSRVVIRNATEYPDAEVAALVRTGFAELELPSRYSVLVRVNHTRVSQSRRDAGDKYVYGASGRAYNFVHIRPDTPRGAAYEARLSIGRPADYPVAWNDRGYAGVRIGELADWREALVAIAAHEGKHIEGYQHEPSRKARRQDRSGRQEEGRCDAYAAYMLRRYRIEASA